MSQSDPSFVTVPEEGLQAAAWENFLEPDEKILWHGRPDAEALWSPTATSRAAVGIPFMIFGGVMLRVTWPQHGNFEGMTPVWIIAGVMIAFGLFYSISAPFRDRARRMRTWYTLTDTRAVIATDIKRRQFTSYPITPDNDITLPLLGAKTSVWFAKKVTPPRDRDDTSSVKLIGFELIKDAPHVYDLLKQVQKGAQ